MKQHMMLVFVLCCMMKIVELSKGRNKENERPRRRQRRRPPRNKMIRSGGKVMNEAECKVQDCNSNVGDSCLSNASSQDVDFVQDNSDYQWFLDYGYRDGGTHQHASILSSLGESYGGPDDVGYYEALSKNLDANLAEADMESFRTEDIHALLTTLPALCTDLSTDVGRRGEMFASVSGSMMAKFDLDSSTSPHSSSQDSAASPDTMSICKSELLFSPVKEIPMPGANFSIDSLDCELYEEHDIMLTCQANKDNYTIAFEGSTMMEDSYQRENDWNRMNKLDASMAKSDSGLTTWSKLKKRSSDHQLRRHPSGNNNTPSDGTVSSTVEDTKSQSMPDLLKHSTFSYKHRDDAEAKKSFVRVFDIQHHSSGSYNSDMTMSMDTGSMNVARASKLTHNFNLVKLFMKQKSASAEGMSTGTDSGSQTESDSSFDGRKTRLERRPSEMGFEDSLVDGKPPRKHDSIREECELVSERSESVEQLTESPSRSDSIFNSYDRFHKIPLNDHNVNNNNSLTTEPKSTVILTKQLPSRLINRSMQTSIRPDVDPMSRSRCGRTVRVVEPSFLNKLKMESDNRKPVYVVYPNYTLPDLEFLKSEQEDVTNVYLIPQKYQEDEELTKKRHHPSKSRRPFSCNDMEALKKKGFNHIRDWDSLTFLLPVECRQVLADVPEFMHVMKNQENELFKPTEKPIFCASPPMRPKRRPMSCECNYKYNATNVSSSSSTTTQPSSGYRGSSTILTDSSQNSPAPSNNMNPLFVYRYDSVTSSEASLTTSEKQRSAPPLPKRSISLQQAETKTPPRPPLPKGILRKNSDLKGRKNVTKRYSMFEMGETDVSEEDVMNRCARKSIHDPYYTGRRTFSEHSTETEDEGVEAGHGTDSSIDERFEAVKIRPPTPPLPKNDQLSDMSCGELEQLEDFLKLSYISNSESNEWDENELSKLRSLVSKFLSLKINKDCDLLVKKSVSFKSSSDETPPNSLNVSAVKSLKNNLVDIREEHESSPETSPKHTEHVTGSLTTSIDMNQKKQLISAITQSVEQLIIHFSTANDRMELENLGDAELNPSIGKLVLSTLCPALYALLSDGLKTSLDTPFGAIHNSVWRVVEASAQQGPLTKALDELVTRINNQDVFSEGMLKFNAFVFGLLSVRSLDAWMSYLRTRETILRKHYRPDALLIAAQTGGAAVRSLVDTSIATLQPLALLPFQIDLLFECKQLHSSLNRIESYRRPPSSPVRSKTSPKSPNNKQVTGVKGGYSIHSSSDDSEDLSTVTIVRKYNDVEVKQRPRSCVDPNFASTQTVDDSVKKRWSGIHSGSKFVQAYDKFVDDVEDDNGPESIDSRTSEDSAPLNGGKFRRLQMKWEMLSGKETANQQSPPLSPIHTPKSKIPRPVSASSPVKQSCIPVLSPKTPPQTNKPLTNKVVTPPGAVKKIPPPSKSGIQPPKKTNVITRTSRVDQLDKTESRPHPIRPSSLPYRPVSAGAQKNGMKPVPARRAVSSSVNRKPQQTQQHAKTPKVVKTLTHRLPSDNGHLPFNEGEKLKVILEVDSKWLLCCRGDQKGLVPRSAVISIAVETAGSN